MIRRARPAMQALSRKKRLKSMVFRSFPIPRRPCTIVPAGSPPPRRGYFPPRSPARSGTRSSRRPAWAFPSLRACSIPSRRMARGLGNAVQLHQVLRRHEKRPAHKGGRSASRPLHLANAPLVVPFAGHFHGQPRSGGNASLRVVDQHGFDSGTARGGACEGGGQRNLKGEMHTGWDSQI